GPILLQERAPLPDGVSEPELERYLAQRGAALLVDAVRGLAAGAIEPLPQDESRATSYSWPRPEDYLLSPERSAQWAYNFVRGIGTRPEPVRIAVGDAQFGVVAALDFDEHTMLGRSWRWLGEELWLQCSPGVLHVRVRPLVV